jgi:hypothetical protein
VRLRHARRSVNTRIAIFALRRGSGSLDELLVSGVQLGWIAPCGHPRLFSSPAVSCGFGDGGSRDRLSDLALRRERDDWHAEWDSAIQAPRQPS